MYNGDRKLATPSTQTLWKWCKFEMWWHTVLCNFVSKNGFTYWNAYPDFSGSASLVVYWVMSKNKMFVLAGASILLIRKTNVERGD